MDHYYLLQENLSISSIVIWILKSEAKNGKYFLKQIEWISQLILSKQETKKDQNFKSFFFKIWNRVLQAGAKSTPSNFLGPTSISIITL